MRSAAPFRRGFTLVEILVSVAVIGILSTIVYMSIQSARDKADDTKRKSDLAQLAIALRLYKEDNVALGTGYPLPGCDAHWNNNPDPEYAAPGPATDRDEFWYIAPCEDYIPGLAPDYIASLPRDPKREEEEGYGYMYTATTDGKSFKLVVHNSASRLILPHEDFARCPTSCATCHGQPNTGEASFAVYTPDMACE